jgi:hypothetical protein
MKKDEILHIVIDSVPTNVTNWIDVLSALLVPTIAVVGIYVAYQQYRINIQRFRHETYERRLAVYKCLQRYLSEILRDGKTTYDRALQFNSEASEAAFLFDESVQNKIDEIYKNSIKMILAHEKMYPANGEPGLPAGKERSKVGEENTELLCWHEEELKNSRLFFAQKLGLKIT